MAPERVLIGLGSNMGDRHANLVAAAGALVSMDGVVPVAIAGVYESRAIVLPGSAPQPDFLNTVIAVDTTLSPENLLGAILEIEHRLGRVRSTSRWEARSIDLDILLFGDRVIDTPGLRVPHPSIVDRAFVMIPLADLVPEEIIPGQSVTNRELASRLHPGALRTADPIHLSAVSDVAD